MPVDVIIFAVIAAFLLWKLRNVINGSAEQSFIKKDFQKNGIVQIIPEDQLKVTTLGKTSEKKTKQQELATIVTSEKVHIKPPLHAVYEAIFALNPNLRLSLIKQDISQIYEDLMKTIEDSNFVITNFAVEIKLAEKIKKQSLAMSNSITNSVPNETENGEEESVNVISKPKTYKEHNVFLQKINDIEIIDIAIAGKMINIVAQIKSEQIVFKENQEGEVIEGSKITPVSVTETLYISRTINGTSTWFLEDIQ